MAFFDPADTRLVAPGTFRPTSSPSGLPATFTPGKVVNPTPDEVARHLKDIYAPSGAIPTSAMNPNVPALSGTPFPGATPAVTTPTPTTTPTTTATGTDYAHRLPNETTEQWVIRTAKGIGRNDIANDPGAVSYWANAIGSKPQSEDMSYWLTKIQTPDAGGSGDSGTAGGFGAFTAPFTGTYVPPVTNFQAPIGTDDPGFKFAVEQGQDAIQRSAAAKGNLLTGGTLKDLASYTTGAALQDYSGAYNRALQSATFNNNTALGAFGQNYDIFRNNQNDPFQKLYATTGLGLNAAGASNSALGNYAGNLGSLGSTYGGDIASISTGQGNARALGTQVGSAQQNQWYQSLSDWLKSHPFTG
jgi:hypothetical protein